jgi:hypothetical protein
MSPVLLKYPLGVLIEFVKINQEDPKLYRDQSIKSDLRDSARFANVRSRE